MAAIAQVTKPSNAACGPQAGAATAIRSIRPPGGIVRIASVARSTMPASPAPCRGAPRQALTVWRIARRTVRVTASCQVPSQPATPAPAAGPAYTAHSTVTEHIRASHGAPARPLADDAVTALAP